MWLYIFSVFSVFSIKADWNHYVVLGVGRKPAMDMAYLGHSLFHHTL